MGSGYRRAVVEVDKVTGEVLRRFPSVQAADRARGIAIGSTAHVCKGRHLSRGRACWRWEDEYDPHESYEGKQNRPIAVRRDGRLLGFAWDLSSLAEATGRDVRSIASTMLNGFRFMRKYELSYLTEMGQYNGRMDDGR